MDLQTLNYKGNNITFDFGDGTKMINATQMAKPFGKPVGNFLRLGETKEYIALLKARYSDVNITQNNQILRVVKGRSGDRAQGTWMHEKLALKFAGWLSPEFEIWVYDRIHELLTEGYTSLKQLSPAEVLVQQAQMLLDQERRTKRLEMQQAQHQADIEELKAKTTQRPNYYSVAGYASKVNVKVGLTLAGKLGRKATRICRANNYDVDKINDPRFGAVNSYPVEVLEEVFRLQKLN